jgi:hypothetical protein
VRGKQMRAAAKLTVRLAILALGALLAVAITTGVGAADTTTDTTTTAVTTTTEPTTETTTAETTTVEGTSGLTTVEITTTRFVPVAGTTTSSDSESSTPAWVWVLLAILAVALIAVIVLLGRRGGGGGGSMSLQDRHRQLDATVGTWAAQGWALETQTDDSAVLRRGQEAMHVSVDKAGHVSTRPLP